MPEVASGVVTITFTVAGSTQRSVASRSYGFPGRRIAYDTDGTLGFLLLSEPLRPAEKGTLRAVAPMGLSGLNGDLAGGLYIAGRQYINQGGGVITIIPGDWGEATYPGARNFIVLFFPDPIRLRGWFSAVAHLWQSPQGPSSFVYPEVELEVSHDSTNGQDGEWHSLDYKDADQYYPYGEDKHEGDVAWRFADGSWWQDQSPVPEIEEFQRANAFRDEFQDGRETGRGWFPIYSGHARNVRTVRLSMSATGPLPSLYAALLLLHLYGEPDTNAGETRLAVVDPVTEVEMIEDPSWGDVDYATESVISVGIKNLSPVATAESVEVRLSLAYPDGNPEYTGVHDFVAPLAGSLQLSLDEMSWTETISLGDLAPEQTVPIFARKLPATGALGLRFAKITAETVGWI